MNYKDSLSQIVPGDVVVLSAGRKSRLALATVTRATPTTICVGEHRFSRRTGVEIGYADAYYATCIYAPGGRNGGETWLEICERGTK
jgi:hypothetical protein